MKRHLIILVMVLVIGGCAGSLTNLTKEGLEDINTAIKKVRDSHVLVLGVWAKNSDFVMASLKDVIEGNLNTLELKALNRFTEIAKIPTKDRKDNEIGESHLILRSMTWKGIREVIRLVAPDLLLLLPGL